jgi:hypothetical protein
MAANRIADVRTMRSPKVNADTLSESGGTADTSHARDRAHKVVDARVAGAVRDRDEDKAAVAVNVMKAGVAVRAKAAGR